MSPESHEPDAVGSLAEEAAKLIGVLAAVGEQRATGRGAAADGDADPLAGESHVPTTCAYCPVCQLIGYVRETSPEAVEHLGASLVSLTSAARSLVEGLAAHGTGATARQDPGVQNIDLSDEEKWNDEA